ncbi:ATP-binding protein [Streptomyces sp. NPDC051921]|uniref:ATP-binding protein n=1 Tax=Streptomyces sp. NPDC051921 TaxID=3155806 RepID=UPI0034393196
MVEPVLPTGQATAEVFVGRGPETLDVLAVLDPTHGATSMVVVSSVAGLAGIGKTALARSCASEAVARGWYPGGAVFVDLNGYAPDPADHVMPQHVFAPLLHALGLQDPIDATVASQAAQYHRLLADRATAGRPVLLVLDNASSNAQISDLLPRSRAHRALVTSRHTLATRGARTLELGTLTPIDARSLVQEQLAFLNPDDTRAQDDAEGTERLCRLCGHLPLALHIATALIDRDPYQTPGALADELARAHRRLDILDDGERAVRAAFELSYQQLTPQQARLFRLLPLNPGPHTATDAAAGLAGVTTDEAAQLIRELARAHVVERAGPGLWRQHDLMRAYAIELLGRLNDNQDRASRRLLDHYIFLTAAAMDTLDTGTRTGAFRTSAEALAWFDREHPNLQAAISMAVTFNDDDAALRIQEGLVALHAHRGQTTEWEAAATSAVRHAKEAQDHTGRSRALHQVALAREATGRAALAAEAAKTLLRFQHLVIQEAREAEPERCRLLLEHAVEAVAESERLLGGHEGPLVDARRREIARVVLERGLQDAFGGAGLPDPEPTRTAVVASSPQERALADIQATLKRLRAASYGEVPADEVRDTARRTLAQIPRGLEAEEAGSWRAVCESLSLLAAQLAAGGPAARMKGQYARERWRIDTLPAVAATYALTVRAYERIRDPSTQARLLRELARECFDSGSYSRAVDSWRHASSIAETLGDEAGQGEDLAGMAHAYLLLDNHGKAAQFAERAAPLLRNAKRTGAAGRAFSTLANARYRLGLPTGAAHAAQSAHALAHSAHDPEGQVAALLILGLAQRDTGREEEAGKSWTAARDISRQLHDRYVVQETRNFLTSVGFPLK